SSPASTAPSPSAASSPPTAPASPPTPPPSTAAPSPTPSATARSAPAASTTSPATSPGTSNPASSVRDDVRRLHTPLPARIRRNVVPIAPSATFPPNRPIARRAISLGQKAARSATLGYDVRSIDRPSFHSGDPRSMTDVTIEPRDLSLAGRYRPAAPGETFTAIHPAN